MSRGRVLITCPQLQSTIDEHYDRLADSGLEVVLPPVVQQLNEAELLELVPGVVGIIAGDDEITRAVLGRADALRIISKWGVGVDNIDIPAAAELGIQVTNTPRMFGDEVADVVVGYLVLLARQLHRLDRSVRAGEWSKPVGVSLANRTLGVIGLGDIGQAVSRRAFALGMNVIGTDVSQESARQAEARGLRVVGIATLLSEADAVSLNCPLTNENWHMIDSVAIATMKQGAWIINTARGPLIDERALVQALHTGHIGGAALDVFEVEPLPAESELRRFDNTILGTHNSSNTTEAVRRTSAQAIENLLAGLAMGGS